MFSRPQLAKAVVLHPVTKPKFMYRLHSFFLEVEFNSSLARLKHSSNVINSAQPFIPSELRSHFHPSMPSNVADSTTSQSPNSYSSKSDSPLVLRPTYRPKNKFEINYWEYFNQTRLMTIMNESPARGIIGGAREEARFALTKAIYLANKGLPQPDRLVFFKLENGYHRVDPMRGSEFILDFVFTRVSDKKKRFRKRLSILRPFHDVIVPIESSEDLPVINFLITLSGLSDRLENFLAAFEHKVLKRYGHATLTIVLFECPEAPKIRQLMDDYRSRYRQAKMDVIEMDGPFARGVGLHHGMKKFSDNQLVFIVDVDLDVSKDFLQRCRLNTIRGKQIYFPVFFKLYNRDFVNRYHRGNHSLLLSRQLGHWAHYSYGMVCLHAGDYHSLKGFDTSMQGWGEEDVDLLNQVLKSNLAVFRAPDPGLIHNWHAKNCNKDSVTNPAAHQHCLQSKGENLADRVELAQYLFEQEQLKDKVL